MASFLSNILKRLNKEKEQKIVSTEKITFPIYFKNDCEKEKIKKTLIDFFSLDIDKNEKEVAFENAYIRLIENNGVTGITFELIIPAFCLEKKISSYITILVYVKKIIETGAIDEKRVFLSILDVLYSLSDYAIKTSSLGRKEVETYFSIKKELENMIICLKEEIKKETAEKNNLLEYMNAFQIPTKDVLLEKIIKEIQNSISNEVYINRNIICNIHSLPEDRKFINEINNKLTEIESKWRVREIKDNIIYLS